MSGAVARLTLSAAAAPAPRASHLSRSALDDGMLEDTAIANVDVAPAYGMRWRGCQPANNEPIELGFSAGWGIKRSPAKSVCRWER